MKVAVPREAPPTLQMQWRMVAFGASLASLALCSSTAEAQSAGPRDYLNTPVNSGAIFLDFAKASSETAAESDLPLPNNEAVSNSGYVSALYSYPLGSQYGGVALSDGLATIKAKTAAGVAQTSGFTDPGITFHANIFGAPALRLEEYRSAVPQTYFSFHFTINAPLGSYNHNSPVNSGANRWAFTPLFNLDITPDKGVSWLDIYAGGRFFTSNDAYAGSNRLTQVPLFTLSAHYSHNITKTIWASIGVYYDNGGATFVNGISQHDAANGFRPTASISALIGKLRFTLRYDNISSTPRAAPNNSLIAIKVSGIVF